MNSSFILLPFSALKALPCWNINFHRFQNKETTEQTFMAGVQDAYCVLIEDFELHPNRQNYANLPRYKEIKFGLHEDFIKTFDITSLSLHIKSRGYEYSLESAYWYGVEHVQKIFIFLANYNHIKLYNNDIVSQSPALTRYVANYYRIHISDTINAYIIDNSNRYTENIINSESRDYIYLDEIFGIDSLFNGYYLDVKKSLEDFKSP